MQLAFNHDAQGRPTTPKFGAENFIRSAAKSLASRPGDQGSASYIQLASVGVPMAEIAPSVMQKVGQFVDKYARQGGKAVIAPNVEFLTPGQRQTLRAFTKARGTEPPAGASDTELVKALHQHKLGLGDIITNIPSSAGRALVGLGLGTIAAGEASGLAAREGLHRLGLPIGHGNTHPVRELLKSTAHYYAQTAQHPLAALERDPVGTTINVVMPAKAAIGGVLGSAARAGMLGAGARAFAEARPAVELPAYATRLERAPAASNLVDRAVQAAADKALSASPTLQRRALAKETRITQARAKSRAYAERNKQLEPLTRAIRGGNALKFWQRTKSDEAVAAIFAHAQGETPGRLAAYYAQKATEAEKPAAKAQLRANRDMWQAIADKYGDQVTPRMRAILDAYAPAVATREESLLRQVETLHAGDTGALPGQQALPGLEGGAGPGAAHAELQQIMQQRRGLVPSEVAQTLGSESPSAAEAVYVKHQPQVNFRDFLSRRKTSYARDVQQELKRNDLALFRSGKLAPSVPAAVAAVAKVPLSEHGLRGLQESVTRFASRAEPGAHYDPERFVLVRSEPARFVQEGARQVNQAKGFAQAIGKVGEDNEAFRKALEQHLEVTDAHGVVPEGLDNGLLVPKPVWDQIKSQPLSNLSRLGVVRGANAVTDAWRFATLFLRPAWLANNIVGNTGQALLAGAGPLSLVRAAKPGFRAAVREAMPELEGGGSMAWLSRRQHIGSLQNTAFGRLLTAINQSPAGIPFRGINHFAEAMQRANVAYENYLRRAVYLHKAVPGARKLGDDVTKALAQNRSDEAATLVARFLGDYTAAPNRPLARLAVPFYRWIGFITKLALWDLPVHHPARAALLNQLGQLGDDEYQKMNLGLTSSLAGAIPLSVRRVQQPDGSTHVVADFLRTGGLNPFATIGQTFNRTANINGNADVSGILGSLNPLASSVLSTAIGQDIASGFPIRNATGEQVNAIGRTTPGQYSSRFGDLIPAAVNQFARTIPLVGLLDNPQGQADTSLPFSRYTGIGFQASKQPQGTQAPQRSEMSRVLGYLTGINTSPSDLTLNAQKNLASQGQLQSLVGKIPTTGADRPVKSEAAWHAWQQQHPEYAWLSRSELYKLMQVLHEMRVATGRATPNPKWHPSGFGKVAPKKTKKTRIKTTSTPAPSASGAGSIYGGGGGGGASSIYG